MATLQDIEQAIRLAHAAGDGDSVLKLAAARDAILSQQKQADQPPFDQRLAQVKQLQAAGQPIPQELQQPDVMNQLTQEAAKQDQVNSTVADYGQEAQKRNVTAARDFETGIPEGGRRLVAGAKQLGASIEDFYNLMVKGKSDRQEDIITLPTGERKRLTDLRDSSAEKKVIAEELIRQQVQEQKDLDSGASSTGRNAVATTTQLGALTAAPELLPDTTTMHMAVLRNSVAGNASNALTFDANGGGLNDAAIASGAPALLSPVTALVPAVKNYVGRAFQRATNAGRSAGRAAAFAEVMPKTAQTLTLAQRTGIPELITLERAAGNSEMVNHFADQTDKFVSEMTDVLRQPLKEGQTLSNDFVATRARAEHNLQQFKIAASDNYEAGIKDAKRIANEGGAGNVVPVNDFRNQMQNTFDKVRGLKERGYKGLGDIDNKFMNTVEGYFKDKSSLNVKELSDLMVDLAARQKAKNPLARKFAGELRSALDNDLNRIEETGTFEADDAVKTILETRAEYRRAQSLIGELGDSAGYKLLGVKDRDVAPDTVLEKFKGFTPEKRRAARDYLEENSPALLATLKDAAVKDAVSGAKVIRAGADSQNDLDQLVNTMFDPKGFDLRTSGLWNDEELKRIEGIKEGLRDIANSRPRAGTSAGTPIKPEDVAINAVAQHPAFLARQLSRVLMSVKGSKFFTDPNVYERLRVISRSTSGSPTNLIARAALLDYLNSQYPQEEKAPQP